jgi:hypothetical protein
MKNVKSNIVSKAASFATLSILLAFFFFNNAEANGNNEHSAIVKECELTEIISAQYAILASERSLMCQDMSYSTLREAQYKRIENNLNMLEVFIKNFESNFKASIKDEMWSEFSNSFCSFKDFNDSVVELSKYKDSLNKDGLLSTSKADEIDLSIMQTSLNSEKSLLVCVHNMNSLIK